MLSTRIVRATIASITLTGAVQAAPEWTSVKSVLSESCFDCHNTRKNKGGIDLARLEPDPSVEKEYITWEKVREVIASGSMPPEDETQLTKQEKDLLLGWTSHELDAVATHNAGDPGPVTLRRLTNAEYDYTIRDLTGIDYGLGKEFLPDGGGGEGFSNIGDVLFTNPTQLEKYLAAARKIADCATILPGTGIVFHPQRIGMRGPDQVKSQADQALYVWYQEMAAPILPNDTDDMREADYMLACWKWKHKNLTGATSLAQLAKDAGLQPAFLENWWKLVNDTQVKSRFLDLTRVAWRELPPPDAAKPKEVPASVLSGCQAIQTQRRSWLVGRVQRRQQDADGIRSDGRNTLDVRGQKEVHLCIGDVGDGGKGDIALVQDIKLQMPKGGQDYVEWLKTQPQHAALYAKFGKHPQGRGLDARSLAIAAPAVLTLPLPDGAKAINANIRLDMQNPEVDAATIQWRFAIGTPPDVTKIMPGVLTIWKRQTQAARTTMGDFGIMKSAFPDEYARRLEEVARNHTRGPSRVGVYYLNDEQLKSIIPAKEAQHHTAMMDDFRFVGPSKTSPQVAADWENRVLKHLRSFASLAWRRPISKEEETQIDTLYREGLKQGLDRESAGREVLARVLVAPHFLFKTELSPVVATGPEGLAQEPEHAVSAWELASRLSYFLWSSKPDGELRAAAANGTLLKPEVREAQVRRMLRDRKAQAMAKEFMGQWLDFAGFDKHSAVDAKKFPEFTPELRADMYRESVTFFEKLIRDDRPVREIISADYSYLNERLARFYGVPGVTGSEFKKVSLSGQPRGGVLGMGSLLTKTSRSHRTSPVLRGNWLLQSVLGTPVPPPPADVPELKEHGPKPATVREMLEQHRDAKACSTCHDRIDPLGFALENFDAIGRFRDKDEAGLPLDTSAQVKSTKFTGFAGLRAYLQSHDDQFQAQFARKLLGYALGRQVLPSDKQLLKTITDKMKTGDGAFSSAVLAVVNSRQFLNRRY